MAVPAAAQLTNKTYSLDVPDVDTLNLTDGEHTVASVDTDHGKLEARVTVKGKVISDNRYFIRGKPLKEIPERQLPGWIRLPSES
jgi:hypothetical protein